MRELVITAIPTFHLRIAFRNDCYTPRAARFPAIVLKPILKNARGTKYSRTTAQDVHSHVKIVSHAVKPQVYPNETLEMPHYFSELFNEPPFIGTEQHLQAMLPQEAGATQRPDSFRGRDEDTNYFICYLPRSGSTHLISLLRNTGILGKPADFFNLEYERLPLDAAHLLEATGVHSIESASRATGGGPRERREQNRVPFGPAAQFPIGRLAKQLSQTEGPARVGMGRQDSGKGAAV
jgi:hypothetical protein